MTIDGPIMLTSTGRYVSPMYPWEWEPDIDEIACHLSQINRFCGATLVPYSVAEHSVRVASLLPDGLQLAGLLHDASEAYTGDWPTYMKHHPIIGAGFRSVENALQQRIDAYYGVDSGHDLVHWADRRLLATEKRDLLPDVPGEWLILRGVKPLTETLAPWGSLRARAEFLEMFDALVAAKAA